MDESYDTWIANLMAGRQSDAEQAARAAFRASQSARPQAPAARPAGIHAAGSNVWGTEDRADGLVSYTLLDGPGRWANCAG